MQANSHLPFHHEQAWSKETLKGLEIYDSTAVNNCQCLWDMMQVNTHSLRVAQHECVESWTCFVGRWDGVLKDLGYFEGFLSPSISG